MAALKGPRRWGYRAYRSLPGPVHSMGVLVQRRRAETAVRALPDVGDASIRLLIGPLNTAGQAHQWARAAATLPGVSALSLSADRRSAAPSLEYPSDVRLDQAMQLHGLAAHRSRVLGMDGHGGMTHVLAESGRPVLGALHTGSLLEDLPALDAAGIRTGVVIHGSEIRDLHRHAELYAYSPFRGDWDEQAHRMQAAVDRTRAVLQTFAGPVFVSTPDLLDFMPGATLLPVMIDVDTLSAAADAAGPAMRRARPVVLHAPSNPRLKGTEAVERVLTDLAERGLLTYRRLQALPHARMAAAIADADVVVDQIVLGNPGVLLAEALAAGRLTVAHLSPEVRQRMTAADSRAQPPPVVEADPSSLADVIAHVVADRSTYQELAACGAEWASRNHDGARAARALSPLLRTSPHP